MRIASFIFFSIFLFSCGNQEDEPDYIWTEEKFTDVLTEVQLAEGIVRLGYHRSSDSAYLNDSIYSAVFRKMEVNQAEFDSNYNYLLKHPERLEKIYENVITNLSTRSAELDGKEAPLEESERID